MKHLIPFALAIVIFMPFCKKDKKSSEPGLTTTAATNITANSIMTGGNITNDGNSAITKKGVAWAIHNNPTVGDSITDEGAGSESFSSNIIRLNANTTYYIRAYAINASGTGYGNEVSVTTAKGLASLSTTAISNIQPLSAVSGGNITNDGGAPITERGVVYSTTANPTILNNKIVSGTGTGAFTATLSPLASQQIYYVRAYATNSYGTAYGNQLQFNAASANTITDVDGNVYPYVSVCGKEMMATSLRTTKYKNGDPITNGVSGYNWSTGTSGAYTFPNGDQNKKDSFGLLYNVYAINDTRGVCPAGWHVPTDPEMKAIEMCQGMTQAQADAGFSARGTVGANFLEGGSSGLNIRKAGYLNNADGTYISYNITGSLWTSTGIPGFGNWLRSFNFSNPDPGPIYRAISGGYALSVRCIKD